MTNLFIKLIIKPGVFLFLKEYISSHEWCMTTIKENALCLKDRASAEELITRLMCDTHWKYNFEISSY